MKHVPSTPLSLVLLLLLLFLKLLLSQLLEADAEAAEVSSVVLAELFRRWTELSCDGRLGEGEFMAIRLSSWSPPATLSR